MATIHQIPNRPEAGRITLRSADVAYLQTGWLVRWTDVEGHEHSTRVISDCEPHYAVLLVATQGAEEFYEQIGDPVRVRI